MRTNRRIFGGLLLLPRVSWITSCGKESMFALTMCGSRLSQQAVFSACDITLAPCQGCFAHTKGSDTTLILRGKNAFGRGKTQIQARPHEISGCSRAFRKATQHESKTRCISGLCADNLGSGRFHAVDGMHVDDDILLRGILVLADVFGLHLSSELSLN